MSLPHADTYAEALPNEDADTAALPELHTNRNGGHAITNPDEPVDVNAYVDSLTITTEHPNPSAVAFPYSVTGGDFNVDAGTDKHADPDKYRRATFGDADNQFTVTYGINGRITYVDHRHADGTEHTCIPDFATRAGAFECCDCGAGFTIIVGRQ